MISEEEVEKLARLCKIACSDEEKKALTFQLSKVLDYVDQLNEIDVKESGPSLFMEEAVCALREDVEGPTLPVEEFLKNSPAFVGGMIKIPTVLK